MPAGEGSLADDPVFRSKMTAAEIEIAGALRIGLVARARLIEALPRGGVVRVGDAEAMLDRLPAMQTTRMEFAPTIRPALAPSLESRSSASVSRWSPSGMLPDLIHSIASP